MSPWREGINNTLRLPTAALGLAAFNLSAQIPAGLDIQIHAGLMIPGAADTVYSIDYVSNLAQMNDPSALLKLGHLPLS